MNSGQLPNRKPKPWRKTSSGPCVAAKLTLRRLFAIPLAWDLIVLAAHDVLVLCPSASLTPS